MTADTCVGEASPSAQCAGDAQAHNSSTQLLDSRQRAMLEAMGITVWQPDKYIEKPAIAQLNKAQAATQIIAKKDAAQSFSTPAQAPVGRARAAQAEAALPHSSVGASFSPTAAQRPAASALALAPLPEGIAQMDWPALQNAVSTCRACALCTSRKNTVFGIGQSVSAPELAPRADWLIVGEAPGEDEDTLGEPFAGTPGKLLDNMLRAMLVDGKPLARHNQVFITNVLKCRPPSDRNPSADEVAMCQPYLLRQIALLQPKIILAMGRFAVQALTGSAEPLGKLRGRVHALHGGSFAAPVIVTYHPAYLLRSAQDKARAWTDLLLAMETLQATQPPAPPPA